MDSLRLVCPESEMTLALAVDGRMGQGFIQIYCHISIELLFEATNVFDWFPCRGEVEGDRKKLSVISFVQCISHNNGTTLTFVFQSK